MQFLRYRVPALLPGSPVRYVRPVGAAVCLINQVPQQSRQLTDQVRQALRLSSSEDLEIRQGIEQKMGPDLPLDEVQLLLSLPAAADDIQPFFPFQFAASFDSLFGIGNPGCAKNENQACMTGA